MIRITHVQKQFTLGGETIEALKNINLTIERGEFLSLIGPSGSGKTTLLNLIGGLEKPTEGQVTINNQDIASMTDKQLSEYRAKKIGYVFQSFNLLPRYNVLKNVTVPAMLIGVHPKVRTRRALEALKSVGLTNRAASTPNKLSGGERQRVAIARAMINDPDVIIADEPTGNLDEQNAKKVLGLLIDLCRSKGKTLILVTHNPELARMADRVVELKNGSINRKARK